MRDIEIRMLVIQCSTTNRDRRVFHEENSKIICAFDYNAFCSPECAACQIYGVFPRAYCFRNGQQGDDNCGEFMIGNLKEDDNKGENQSGT